MVDPHISEDEQAERLKQWWKQNGTSVIAGISLGVAAVLGWNWWQNQQVSRAAAASDRYEMAVAAEREEQPERLAEAVAALKADAPKSDYAAQAALVKARQLVNADDIDGAIDELRWVVDRSTIETTREVARLRLAGLLIGRGELDAAAALLDGEPAAGFESHYSELKGDIALARGDAGAARSHYQSAIDTLIQGSGYGEILEMKLDNAAAGSS